ERTAGSARRPAGALAVPARGRLPALSGGPVGPRCRTCHGLDERRRQGAPDARASSPGRAARDRGRTVTERWRKKLEGIDEVAPRDDVYERAKAGPTLPEAQSPMQRTSTRVATAIAAFVVFALAISLFAIPTLRLHDESSALSAGGQLLPLWPARTVEQVQALQDEADAGRADWALDPQQVATRFGQVVLGWPDVWVSPLTSNNGCNVASGPYPSGSYAARAFVRPLRPADYAPTTYPPPDVCDPSMLLCGGLSSQPRPTSSSAGQFVAFQLSRCDPTTSCNL